MVENTRLHDSGPFNMIGSFRMSGSSTFIQPYSGTLQLHEKSRLHDTGEFNLIGSYRMSGSSILFTPHSGTLDMYAWGNDDSGSFKLSGSGQVFTPHSGTLDLYEWGNNNSGSYKLSGSSELFTPHSGTLDLYEWGNNDSGSYKISGSTQIVQPYSSSLPMIDTPSGSYKISGSSILITPHSASYHIIRKREFTFNDGYLIGGGAHFTGAISVGSGSGLTSGQTGIGDDVQTTSNTATNPVNNFFISSSTFDTVGFYLHSGAGTSIASRTVKPQRLATGSITTTTNITDGDSFFITGSTNLIGDIFPHESYEFKVTGSSSTIPYDGTAVADDTAFVKYFVSESTTSHTMRNAARKVNEVFGTPTAVKNGPSHHVSDNLFPFISASEIGLMHATHGDSITGSRKLKLSSSNNNPIYNIPVSGAGTFNNISESGDIGMGGAQYGEFKVYFTTGSTIDSTAQDYMIAVSASEAINNGVKTQFSESNATDFIMFNSASRPESGSFMFVSASVGASSVPSGTLTNLTFGGVDLGDESPHVIMSSSDRKTSIRFVLTMSLSSSDFPADTATVKYVGNGTGSGASQKITSTNFALTNKINEVFKNEWITATYNGLTIKLEGSYKSTAMALPITSSYFNSTGLEGMRKPVTKVELITNGATGSYNLPISGAGIFNRSVAPNGVPKTAPAGLTGTSPTVVEAGYKEFDSGLYHVSNSILFRPYSGSAIHLYYNRSGSSSPSGTYSHSMGANFTSELFRPYKTIVSCSYPVGETFDLFSNHGYGLDNLWHMNMRHISGGTGYNASSSNVNRYNNAYFERQFVFHDIGDSEVMSASFKDIFSFEGSGSNLITSSVLVLDFTDDITFHRRRIVNSASFVPEKSTHRSYRIVTKGTPMHWSSSTPIAGKPMGRTAYFATSSTEYIDASTGDIQPKGTLLYPDNHHTNFPSSKEGPGIRHLFYEGTTSDTTESFWDPTYVDWNPSSSVATGSVGGSNTGDGIWNTNEEGIEGDG
mgnify:CR=1 FL=1